MPPKQVIVKRPTPPQQKGEWSSGLCDCCEDPLLACSMCICPCNATGQVYERSTRTSGSCLWVAALLWALFFVTQILQSTSNSFSQAYAEETTTDATPMIVLSSLAGSFAFFTTVAGTYFLCVARRTLRKKENIQEGACGGCDDCCVSYWCGCCSLTQMFRQYNVTGQSYRTCTVSGEQMSV